MHGARDQWLATFVYEIDNKTEPAVARRPMRFTEAYCAHVTVADFRRNPEVSWVPARPLSTGRASPPSANNGSTWILSWSLAHFQKIPMLRVWGWLLQQY